MKINKSIFNKLSLPKKKKRVEDQFSAKPRKKFTLKQINEKIFGFRHSYTRAQWVRFMILFVVAVYFVGLVFEMALAYYPMKPGKTGPVEITSKEKYIGLTANIYPLPAAVVNNDVISLRDFYKQISYIKHYQISSAQNDKKVNKEASDDAILYNRILGSLIDNRLIRQAAAKEKISVSDDDVNKTYQEVVNSYEQIGGYKNVEDALRKLYDMSPAEFKSLISDEILKEKIRKNLLVQIRISHVLVTDKSRLKDAQAALKKGTAFDKVAKQYSMDVSTQKQGGDLGWLSRQDLSDQISPAFEKAVGKLKLNQVSAPIKTDMGYHLVKLTGVNGKIDMSFDAWLVSLRKDAKIIRFVKAG